MDIEVNDKCIRINEDWLALHSYKVRSVGERIEIGPFLDVENREPSIYVERNELFISPYSLRIIEKSPRLHKLAIFVRNLACSHLRKHQKVEVTSLIEGISRHGQLESIEHGIIENLLNRTYAASTIRTAGLRSSARR